MESILYFVFVHITLLVPGYVLLAKLKIFEKNTGFTIVFGYIASVLFFASLAALYYLINIPQLMLQIIFWSSMAISLFLLVYEKLYLQLIPSVFIIGSFVAMSFFSLCFSGLTFQGPYTIIPDPEPRPDRNYNTLNVKILNVAQTNANDNYIPYRQAQFIVNKSNPAKDSFIEEWGVHFFQRTPLMGAITAQYFLALEDIPPTGYTWSNDALNGEATYQKFQIIAQILNCIFIVPAFFLLRKIFNRKVAAASLLFIIPSQFFLYNTFFSWPKSLVAFFIIASWLLLLASRKTSYVVAAGVVSGLSYLTHDLAVLYIGASFIYLLATKRLRDSIILVATSAIFALPWLFIASVIFHKPSSFIYYPISTKGIPQPGEIKQIVHEFLQTSPFRLFIIRVDSLFYILSPYQLIIDESNQGWLQRIWASGLFSIPGSIGPGLVIPVILYLLKFARNFKYWLFIVTPLILSVIVIGWPHGLGSIHFAQAVVVLLVGIALSFLLKLRSKWWLFAAYIINTAQLILFVLYSYHFSFAFHLSDILQLGMMVLIVMMCGIGIYNIAASGNKRAFAFSKIIV